MANEDVLLRSDGKTITWIKHIKVFSLVYLL